MRTPGITSLFLTALNDRIVPTAVTALSEPNSLATIAPVNETTASLGGPIGTDSNGEAIFSVSVDPQPFGCSCTMCRGAVTADSRDVNSSTIGAAMSNDIAIAVVNTEPLAIPPMPSGVVKRVESAANDSNVTLAYAPVEQMTESSDLNVYGPDRTKPSRRDEVVSSFAFLANTDFATPSDAEKPVDVRTFSDFDMADLGNNNWDIYMIS